MKYHVIAIERQYGSGGSEIGAKLAEKLGVPCYGREILERAAAKLGVPAGDIERQEETVTSTLAYSLKAIARLPRGEMDTLTEAQKLCLVEADVIRELAHQGPCVIVGRSAASAVQDEYEALKVFVWADTETRLRRAIEVYGIPADKASAVLRRFDRRRSQYYKTVAGEAWGEASNVHIMADSGYLGVDRVADMLAAAS